MHSASFISNLSELSEVESVHDISTSQGSSTSRLLIQKRALAIRSRSVTANLRGMKRLQHLGFDPSCDCWCCNKDLRFWCIIISFFRLVILCILEICIYIASFHVQPHEHGFPKRLKHHNQMPHNKSGFFDITVEPKMIFAEGYALNDKIPIPDVGYSLVLPRNIPSGKFTDRHDIYDLYLPMCGTAFACITVSIALFVGAKCKNTIVLAVVPLFISSSVGCIIWIMKIEHQYYLTFIYMLAILFEFYVILCAMALLCHINKGYYSCFDTCSDIEIAIANKYWNANQERLNRRQPKIGEMPSELDIDLDFNPGEGVLPVSQPQVHNQ